MEYQTRCGGRLVVSEKAAQHLAAHPEMQELLSEAAAMIDLPKEEGMLEAEIDFKRPLGPATLVPTARIDENEEVLFAQRPNRKGASRVVVLSPDEIPAITTFVVVAKPGGDNGAFNLITSYRGVLAPGEPWYVPPEKFAQSMTFWCSHALVWDKTMGATFVSTWTNVIANARAAV